MSGEIKFPQKIGYHFDLTGHVFEIAPIPTHSLTVVNQHPDHSIEKFSWQYLVVSGSFVGIVEKGVSHISLLYERPQ
jgi:hypothetical protein